MYDFIMNGYPGARRTAMAVAVAASCVVYGGGAAAIEIATGNDDMSVRFDNTIRYNFGHRTESPTASIIANPNYDDGDRNFKKGSTVNNRIDLLSELDVIYQKNFGARISATAWYDQSYSGAFNNGSLATSNRMVDGAPASGLSRYADRYYNGLSGEVLDAFVFGNMNIDGQNFTVRAGRHVVNWGEGLLLGGAVHGNTYGQAPLDAAKAFNIPGVEAKELYRPLAQVSTQWQPLPELSIAGQYFFKWEASRLPEAGSYLGFSDAYDRGGESLINPGLPGGRAVRGRDITPEDSGEFGLAVRWSPRWLDGTAGLYARRFSDKLPQLGLNLNPLLAGKPAEYFLSYGSDIQLLGLSLAKQVGPVSLGIDLNYRKNMPLASDAVRFDPGQALPGQGETVGARGNTLHLVVNALGVMDSNSLWDSASWSTELTWSRWQSVTQGEASFKGRASYTDIDKVSRDAAALGVNLTPTWFQVWPGMDLLMPMSMSAGLWGNSAVSFGGNRHAGNYALGVALDMYQKYRFDLRYIDYFGATRVDPVAGLAITPISPYSLLKDRGAIYLTFKTTF